MCGKISSKLASTSALDGKVNRQHLAKEAICVIIFVRGRPWARPWYLTGTRGCPLPPSLATVTSQFSTWELVGGRGKNRGRPGQRVPPWALAGATGVHYYSHGSCGYAHCGAILRVCPSLSFPHIVPCFPTIYPLDSSQVPLTIILAARGRNSSI